MYILVFSLVLDIQIYNVFTEYQCSSTGTIARTIVLGLLYSLLLYQHYCTHYCTHSSTRTIVVTIVPGLLQYNNCTHYCTYCTRTVVLTRLPRKQGTIGEITVKPRVAHCIQRAHYPDHPSSKTLRKATIVNTDLSMQVI